jgi:hypothetical protein
LELWLRGRIVSQATPFSERRVWYFAIELFVLDQEQHVTHGAMNIINNQYHTMHCGQSTPPNYRGEPEQTALLQSTRPFFPRRVWLARLKEEYQEAYVAFRNYVRGTVAL